MVYLHFLGLVAQAQVASRFLTWLGLDTRRSYMPCCQHSCDFPNISILG